MNYKKLLGVGLLIFTISLQAKFSSKTNVRIKIRKQRCLVRLQNTITQIEHEFAQELQIIEPIDNLQITALQIKNIILLHLKR